MLFAVINGIFFIASGVIFSVILRNSKHAPILRVKVQTKKGEEYRYFTDYAYAVGLLYTVLCALIFLFHIYIGSPQKDWNEIIYHLNNQQEYYFFMAAVSLSNGFLIIPERSIVLEKYQIHFGMLTIVWLVWSGVINLLA